MQRVALGNGTDLYPLGNQVVGDMLHVTAAKAATMIEAWLDSRLPVPARWRDGGRIRAGLAVDGSRRPREPVLVPPTPVQAAPVQATKDFSV